MEVEFGEGGRDASCAGTVDLILLVDTVEVGCKFVLDQGVYVGWDGDVVLIRYECEGVVG